MKAAGVLYPRYAATPTTPRCGTSARTGRTAIRPRHPRRLGRCVRRVTKWEGPTAVMSSELFVYADQASAKRALTAFGTSRST